MGWKNVFTTECQLTHVKHINVKSPLKTDEIWRFMIFYLPFESVFISKYLLFPAPGDYILRIIGFQEYD